MKSENFELMVNNSEWTAAFLITRSAECVLVEALLLCWLLDGGGWWLPPLGLPARVSAVVVNPLDKEETKNHHPMSEQS